MRDEKCKICRREGIKLFLKGQRCLTAKCPMVKRPYPPGQKRKRRKGPPSEYGKELSEKQKLKFLYNLSERQFKNYIHKTLKRRGKTEDLADFLIQTLESRLDNVVFRLGFTLSRPQARQLVSHNFFLVNKKPMNLPSYQMKIGEVISVKSQKLKKNILKNIENLIKKYKPPTWLELNVEKLEGKVVGKPTLEQVAPPVEISAIFEFYSR